MENKMINVEVLEGSLVLSPLQSPKECELLFETWMLINSPDGLEDYSKNKIENIVDKLNGTVEINAIAKQPNLQSLIMTYREKVENKEEYDKHFGIEIKRQGETKSPFPTEQLKEWAELILDSEEGRKLKEEMDEDFKNRILGVEQPQQDPIGHLMELGYTEGKIFHRKSCDNYNCGYGIFTGEFGKNCDGITLKFTDGREFLSDFCTLIKDNSPQVMWDITKELQRLQNHYEDNLIKFKQQYLNLK